MVRKIDGQEVEIHGDVWLTHIKKPLYKSSTGYVVSLNGKLLEEAEKYSKKLVVTCMDARFVTTATQWKVDGRRYEKVFKRPDEPMVLYEREIPLQEQDGNTAS